MKTVEQRWQEFAAKVYPGADQNIEQMRQLKAAWFASYFDALNLMSVDIPGMDEMEAVKMIVALKKEAATFVREYIQQEYARQDAGIRP